jgi:ubiquinol-cytochrome c reductase cytochrome c1 subunit
MHTLRLALLAAITLAAPAFAQEETPTPPRQEWSFTGAFNSPDQAAARRGFQVYQEGCSGCHGLAWMHYRDLSQIGFTTAQIADIASKNTVPAGVDINGKPLTAPATPASFFAAPFPTEDAARAAMNGALPPDLSLAVNSHANGPDYIYALLNGYRDAPAGVKLPDGMNYNLYFPGHAIAMPPPLSPGQFTYADGTVSTPEQNAHDVVTFLAFAANPEMAERKHLAPRVIFYFLGMAGITYFLQKRVWEKVK